jgi:predicted phage terminase large subunit-like protein
VLSPQQALKHIEKLPVEQQQELLEMLDKLKEAERQEVAREDYLSFVKQMWPGFIEGRHHKIMADAFQRIADGSLKRLIINMPPRHTKSEFASHLFPAYFLGRYPDRKIIQTSHTAELATSFGRRVRNLVDTQKFQQIFPDTSLSADAKAAGRWDTSRGGFYFAIGVGGKLAGYGADLLIIDDPHSEQDYIQARQGDVAVFDKAYEWYTSGPRQRLQPGAAIVIVMTRWHKRDITGRIVKRMTSGDVDDWEIIEFPALMPESDNPLWPEFWPKEELIKIRAELPAAQWNAQFLQNPTGEEGAIVKREWWNVWERDAPPVCEFTIMSWDTAFLKKERSDRCAMTLWGVFYMDDEEGRRRPNLILLDAIAERMEFPELKRRAIKEWNARQPDAFIVEAKASGLPLIQELRMMGIPVQDFTPHRGSGDKIARFNSVADIFASGLVWAPETRWAEETIEELAAFPQGDHDDLVDSTSQALLRFRQGGFISLYSDYEDEPFYPERREYY